MNHRLTVVHSTYAVISLRASLFLHIFRPFFYCSCTPLRIPPSLLPPSLLLPNVQCNLLSRTPRAVPYSPILPLVTYPIALFTYFILLRFFIFSSSSSTRFLSLILSVTGKLGIL
jgi:hypothetical protein